MVAIIRSAAVGAQVSPGQNVWALLCRTALRGIDWAAEACAVKDGENRVERAELLVSCGIAPEPPVVARRTAVDWAKLDELERVRLSRGLRGAEWR
jgi:hypothetical protein